MFFSQPVFPERRQQTEINRNNLLKPAVTFSQLSKQTLHLYQHQLVRVSHSSRRDVFPWLGINIFSLFLFCHMACFILLKSSSHFLEWVV